MFIINNRSACSNEFVNSCIMLVVRIEIFSATPILFENDLKPEGTYESLYNGSVHILETFFLPLWKAQLQCIVLVGLSVRQTICWLFKINWSQYLMFYTSFVQLCWGPMSAPRMEHKKEGGSPQIVVVLIRNIFVN